MNHGVAGGSQEVVSRAGIAVWRFLRSGDRRHAMLLLAHPHSAPELIYQAWVLAMRRTFSREADDRLVAEHLRGVINRTDVSASHIAELIDLALHNSSTVDRSVKNRLLPILVDLVRSRFPSDSQIAELVRAAEIRTERLRRKNRKSPQVRRAELLPAGGPRSVVGQILKAQSAYDRELLSALPDEESDRAVAEVVDRAAVAMVKERFPQPPSAELMSRFAGRIAKSSRDARLDKILAEEVVRGALLPPADSVVDAPDDLLLHAKMMTFVQAVEDLGMYPWEVDRVIVAAERAAENAGVRLTAMP